MSRITVIPATRQQFTSIPLNAGRKKRVAGYARVSTDTDEQITSYEAQVDYYTSYIQSNPEWELVQIYTDEGISATNTKHRDGFNRMIADALAGKIDMIVTKSVSRFARNTVDSLTTIRQLKEKGINVWFEKEGIDTSDAKGELLITIMSSLAQEESRSISENTTWGIRKRMADGKVVIPFKRFLGYDRGEDGQPVINEEQANTVRLIYRLYLEGKTPCGIARYLTESGIPTTTSKTVWHSSCVESILTNVKFKGDALLQRYYSESFLTKKQLVNQGQIPQYYISNSHPAIIEPDVFDMIQQEMQRRKDKPERYSASSIFSGKILCGQCGGVYGSKVWHSTDKYRRVIYQCNNKYKGQQRCTTPHLTEDDIKKWFVSATNKLLAGRNEILAGFDDIKGTVFDTTALDAEAERLQTEMAGLARQVQSCIDENAHAALNQDEYHQRYNALVTQYEDVKARFDEAELQRQEKLNRRMAMEAFLCELRDLDGVITEFDERLWGALVESVTVFCCEDIRFSFKDGSESNI